MKRFMITFFAVVIVSALASFSALAGDKNNSKVEKKMITFTENVMVNGTLVKPGDYEVKFDDSTNELSILKNGKVIAKTPAHTEARSEKAKNTALRTMDKGGNPELIGVSFGGSDRDVIVGANGSNNGTQ